MRSASGVRAAKRTSPSFNTRTSWRRFMSSVSEAFVTKRSVSAIPAQEPRPMKVTVTSDPLAPVSRSVTSAWTSAVRRSRTWSTNVISLRMKS